MYTQQVPGLLLRRFNKNYAQNGTRLASFFGRSENYRKFGTYRRRLSFWVREQGEQLALACTRQFEFIAAQRIRRSLQIFHLYSRIWDEVALKEFIKSWRFRVLRNSRHFLMSSIGVTMYNWDRERITNDELNSYKQEIEGIHRLKDSTVVCTKCRLRTIIDNVQPGVQYCKCHDTGSAKNLRHESDGWTPFIEREDMLIWRKEEPNSGGLFSYKVYGSFADVTAEDFLQVQIDVDYRKEWDATARELKIIDTDPKSTSSMDHSTDVVYWEMIWPRLFANRDYVYQRRWDIDKERGLIIIISRVTEHPGAPSKPGIYRVTSYWSYMVIRPYTEFHQPGIEFGLTYFDDPGVNIPSAVTAWVAMTGLPDFLIRMRQASKNYRRYKVGKQGTVAPDTGYVTIAEDDILQEKIVKDRDAKLERNEMSTEGEKVKNQKDVEQNDALKSTEGSHEASSTDEDEDKECKTTTQSEKDRGFLHHFFLTKLFA